MKGGRYFLQRRIWGGSGRLPCCYGATTTTSAFARLGVAQPVEIDANLKFQPHRPQDPTVPVMKNLIPLPGFKIQKAEAGGVGVGGRGREAVLPNSATGPAPASEGQSACGGLGGPRSEVWEGC